MANSLDMKTEYAHIKRGGVDLFVKNNGKMFGTLTVTNTTVSWYPANSAKPISLKWSKFDKVMKEQEA